MPSFQTILRRELSRPPEADFPSLLRLEYTRRNNPYAQFQCFRLEDDQLNFSVGPATVREIHDVELTSLLSVARIVGALRNQLPWALDKQLGNLLCRGSNWTLECGSPAFVEIHTFKIITELPENESIYFEHKTYLKITYV